VNDQPRATAVLSPVEEAFTIHWIVVWVELNVHRDARKSNKSASSSRKQFPICTISGFRRDVDRICVILGFHAAWSGNSGPKLEDDIKTDLQDGGCRGMGWIEVAQDKDRWRALENAVTNFRFL
jgi:hypothetical protein